MTHANDVSSNTASLPITLEQLAISFDRIWNVSDVTSAMIMSTACHMTKFVLVGTTHINVPTKTEGFHL